MKLIEQVVFKQNTAETLQRKISALNSAVTRTDQMLVRDVDGRHLTGMTLWEETLSDGSTVQNLELEFE